MKTLLCLWLLVLAIAASASEAVPDDHRRTLRVVMPESADSLDPIYSTSTVNAMLSLSLFEPLIASDAEDKMIMGAAANMARLDNGRVYRFTLREGLRWSDGQPLTARDFKTTVERLVDPAIRNTAQPKVITAVRWLNNAQAIVQGDMPVSAIGVRVISDRVIDFELREPIGFFDKLLLNRLYPSPTHLLAKYGESWSEPAHHQSNGPYRLKRHQGGITELAINPFYRDHQALFFQHISYSEVSEKALIGMLAQNRFDITLEYGLLKSTHWITRQLNYRQFKLPYGPTTFLYFNTRKPHLSDRRVRHAIQLALLPERMQSGLQKIFPNLQTSYSILDHYALSGHRQILPEWRHWPNAKRIERARALLKAAGYNRQHPLKVQFTTYAEEISPLGNMLQSQLAGVGIALELVKLKPEDYQRAIFGGSFGIASASWIPPFADPAASLKLFESGSSLNLSGWHSEKYDRLMKIIYHQPPGPKRQQAVTDAQQVLLDEVPVIPMYYATENDQLVGKDIEMPIKDRFMQPRYMRRSAHKPDTNLSP